MRVMLAVIALTALLSGCTATASTQPSPSGPFPSDNISEAQAAEIADGVVTSDEYHAAFNRFSACVKAGGFDLLVEGEKYDLINYSIPGAARDAGVDEPCYFDEFAQVDTIWQLAHADTSYTAEVHRNCLIDNGISPKETEEEMWQQLKDANIDTTTCKL